MPDSKPNSIPQWQRSEVRSSAATVQTPMGGKLTAADGLPLSREELMEQAAKFLEHKDIRDASVERKVAFLESKGLKYSDVREILGILPEDSASAGAVISPGAVQTELANKSESGQEGSSTAPSSVPPIITYPEFLLHSQRPPPIINTSRVLSTLYISSAAAVTIYGTSQYVLKPMLDSLTTARHSFFDSASSNLNTLNQKLESMVSVMPAGEVWGGKRKDVTDFEDNYGADTESETSDPAELFHRDTGTQTSPPPFSRNSSPSIASSDISSESPLPASASKLKTLYTDLSSVLDSETFVTDEDDILIDGLKDFKQYLNELTYGKTTLGYQEDKNKPGLNDGINRVKAEIRGVKGVLLSARSFPGTGAIRHRGNVT